MDYVFLKAYRDSTKAFTQFVYEIAESLTQINYKMHNVVSDKSLTNALKVINSKSGEKYYHIIFCDNITDIDKLELFTSVMDMDNVCLCSYSKYYLKFGDVFKSYYVFDYNYVYYRGVKYARGYFTYPVKYKELVRVY